MKINCWTFRFLENESISIIDVKLLPPELD